MGSGPYVINYKLRMAGHKRFTRYYVTPCNLDMSLKMLKALSFRKASKIKDRKVTVK